MRGSDSERGENRRSESKRTNDCYTVKGVFIEAVKYFKIAGVQMPFHSRDRAPLVFSIWKTSR
ncbi:MAG: hypothetical protein CR997_13910 [Acidobacteria bacterium]|nr:MAG: hypothetical protein CR997_13910 [Acidobacteriota bacterium]